MFFSLLHHDSKQLGLLSGINSAEKIVTTNCLIKPDKTWFRIVKIVLPTLYLYKLKIHEQIKVILSQFDFKCDIFFEVISYKTQIYR